jgi:hypothetical protein
MEIFLICFIPHNHYIKLNIPFCRTNIPAITQINPGIWNHINKIKITPPVKSIQLAKFFNCPRAIDLINKIHPNIIKSAGGTLNPEINNKINPPMKSITPKI